jgi:superfamily II DNA or RNA helicase
MFENSVETEKRQKKKLYGYQKAISMPYLSVWTMLKQHQLYQLPTGGGKTVVFSEIVRRYLSKTRRKLLYA